MSEREVLISAQSSFIKHLIKYKWNQIDNNRFDMNSAGNSQSPNVPGVVAGTAVGNPMIAARQPSGTSLAATAAAGSAAASGSSRVETLYDKLNLLAEEIAQGIFNLTGGRREMIQREIDDLRDASYRERSPEAVYSILLFRKYADIANAIKDGRGSGDKAGTSLSAAGAAGGGGAASSERMSLIGELPDFVFHPEDETLLRGHNAFSTIVFRLRCVAAALAVIVFAVMSATPHITDADYAPEDHISSSCSVSSVDGQFNFRAYQFVIAVGVLSFVQNAVFLVYYWLPVSESSGNKFVPGLSAALGACCRDPAKGSEYAARVSLACTQYAKHAECIADAVLLLFDALGFIVSLWILQLPVEFTIDKEKEYYTLSTNYLTLAKWVSTTDCDCDCYCYCYCDCDCNCDSYKSTAGVGFDCDVDSFDSCDACDAAELPP